VAEQLKIPVGTVRSRLFRARQQLQEILTPEKKTAAYLVYNNTKALGKSAAA